ncbi:MULTISPECIES: rhodanese-like domain-containing protein [unclassified Marinobacterium]|jgi:rhodanese-related sulfurtransferase|uniref:rhodanese-like domain-containing protein n=1 Tax=unclassified Marinobacterium TaxID=2644139 RepID=UPI00156A72C9|nr:MULTISPECIES: rhodanese-like domain-containing protein [unclassified Marinobacterium]NRP10888.1 Thiosulfate sulfurtransferase PspE precursor [Marinobacterium sp. xm-g-48]NRP14831.1 Thiosulfate sulfurtransferase PspE precursor [Marinobacterium sp. xm-a-152]NRP36810.1 Thiosulfate sulfurtransferase PspE precursor [Marinobacterium sp. xm-d-579]NRP38563.1 Thiosulfate sulfurtransferase PspE precursor [Marinobacterium sp. xm-a-121]NRP46709.1 Thiosulfate sulfurtransferase PspE precursor [Marinobact
MKTAQDLVMAAKATIKEVSVADADGAIHDAEIVIDVREPAEYEQGHLSGAINIPRGLLEFKIGGMPALESRDTNIVIYCKTSGRAALAAASLAEMGYLNVTSIAGGYDGWVEAGKPVVTQNLPEFG